MNENALTKEQMFALIQLASKKLGTTPTQLAESFNKGGLDGISAGLSPENAARLQSFVGDKQRAEQLLNSPKAQEVIRQLLEKRQG